MAMNPGSNQNEYASINVTPMIDVLLVLLIIFMSIAPQRAVGLDALVPQPADAASARPPENPVVLEIAPDKTYRLNSEPVASDALQAALAGVFSRRADRVLFVRASRDLEFASVVAALDIAHSAGIDHVALDTGKSTGSPRI